MLTVADKGGRGGLDPPFLADIICEQPPYFWALYTLHLELYSCILCLGVRTAHVTSTPHGMFIDMIVSFCTLYYEQ